MSGFKLYHYYMYDRDLLFYISDEIITHLDDIPQGFHGNLISDFDISEEHVDIVINNSGINQSSSIIISKVSSIDSPSYKDLLSLFEHE